ncbi:MAG TPA: fumarylacetoacetate hydrolase family protein [Magnetospirillaceae bacterium]|jgi:fumarylacetoacetate (FAA) hydrolase family protein
MHLDIDDSLPIDRDKATLIGRAWVVHPIAGPAVIAIRGDDVIDISSASATVSGLLERDDAVAAARDAPGKRIGSLAELLANSGEDTRDAMKPFLLAPCDLQVIKAAGVTFAVSLIERLIEEKARGNPDAAKDVRQKIIDIVGNDLRSIVPGSDKAAKLKAMLIEQSMWSQYLEVGIGPDAEVFTKTPVLASVGTGADIGIHPKSTWNNPEPEVVVIANSRGKTVGATLGNDVNLRDFEGRSALLLGKAKDQNASSAIGPFIRLFDDHYTIEDVRTAEITVKVEGPDQFRLQGKSSMRQISRDPLDLVAQTLSTTHQYPDGVALFLGTMFAPIDDRHEKGAGFTHVVGDIVTIATPKLGALVNRVAHCDKIRPWSFGIGSLMRNLAQRGLTP